MFDRVEIEVKAGDGGDGMVHFRREKFAPFGGPDGGDGGYGGDIVMTADPGVHTLRSFQHKRFYHADDGANGKSKKLHGRNGAKLVIKVPPGTIILNKTAKGEQVFSDLEQEGQQVVVARGGKGGWGNTHFVSSTNQAPKIAQKGEPGEEKSIILELRLIADAGIIGYPNSGKSSLLAAVSAAKPKIASYPFTTLEPVLGVVEVGEKSFVLAEIPGLIEGAHLGRGLGYEFLRHAMRTRILIHLIDGSFESPEDCMAQVNSELTLFAPSLAEKPQIVAVNKIDLPEVRARMDDIRLAFAGVGIFIFCISALTGEGVPQLMAAALKMLDKVTAEVETKEKVPQAVFRPKPRRSYAIVHKEGDIFVIISPELERIVSRVDMTSSEVRWQLYKQLGRLGVIKALEKAGTQRGDRIRCGGVEWEW
jgi:GTP-binding protein